MSLFTAAVRAELVEGPPGLVKDSYIVTFKSPAKGEAPVVWPPDKMNRGRVPFMQHSSGQSKDALAAHLKLKGEVVSIFDTINAIHVRMSAEEAQRLGRDKRVLTVEQDDLTTGASEENVGDNWGLDRLDEVTPNLDKKYNRTSYNGRGRVIYIIDSGVALYQENVWNEFNISCNHNDAFEYFGKNDCSRVTNWDINLGYIGDGSGVVCNGHGTGVAGVAAGKKYGVANGAMVVSIKITNGCTTDAYRSNEIAIFNWLTSNAPAGSIVNWSRGYRNEIVYTSGGYDCTPIIHVDLEAAITAAHDAGIIVVVAAHNDGCDTADFTPTRIPQAFVIGGTSKDLLNLPFYSKDDLLFADAAGGPRISRTGANISAFAPAENVSAVNMDGVVTGEGKGTSLATGYMSGLFATFCQRADIDCDNVFSAASTYETMRNLSDNTTDTVVMRVKGDFPILPLPNGTVGRFIPKT